MKKLNNWFFLGMVLWTLNLCSYISTKEINNVDLLKSSSEYVKTYDGDNPQSALDSLSTTIDIVAESNTIIGDSLLAPAIEDLYDLRNQVYSIDDRIDNDTRKEVYKPAFDYLAEEVNDYAKDNSKRTRGIITSAIWLTILGGSQIVSLLCYKD